MNDRFPLCVLPSPLTIGEGSKLGARWVQETSGEPDRPKKEVSKSPESRRSSEFRNGQVHFPGRSSTSLGVDALHVCGGLTEGH